MEWMCEWCGAPHEANEPPCEHCGHGSFEKAYRRRTDAAGVEPSPPTQWVCEECGRGHPKHAPPCSRCGHMALEQREVDVDPAELSAGYADLASPRYLALAAVALLAAAVLGLGVLGVVDVPGVGAGSGGADLPDAPGDATSADGTSLAVLEADYLATQNDERVAEDAARLRRTDELDEIATIYNRRWVRSEYAGEELQIGELRERVAAECRGNVVLAPFEVVPGAYDAADAPGETIAKRTLEQRGELATASATETGLDAHVAPDGRLYLTQVVC